MVNYELLYFQGAGRAETIRIMLHAAGVDFKDTRFSGPEWPEIKPTTPLGSVPVLKIDNVQYCQSTVSLITGCKCLPQETVLTVIISSLFEPIVARSLCSKVGRILPGRSTRSFGC